VLAKTGTAITTMATSSSGKNFFMGGIIAMLLWAFDSPKAKRTMLGNRKSTAQKPERLHDER
jgi:hypothetical protein